MDWSYIWILLYVEGSQDGSDIKGNNLQPTIRSLKIYVLFIWFLMVTLRSEHDVVTKKIQK